MMKKRTTRMLAHTITHLGKAMSVLIGCWILAKETDICQEIYLISFI